MPDAPGSGFQSVGQRRIPDRTLHVWRKNGHGWWKCVLCGGVSRRPTMDGLPEKWEPLTDEERGLSPPLFT
jgi:hypothetical protein